MKFIFAVAAAALVAASAYAQDKSAASNNPTLGAVSSPAAAQVDWVPEFEQIVANSLNDPDSAKFDSVYQVSITEPKRRYGYHTTQVVCGYVNGKNLYGAYSGRRPFFAWALNDGETVRFEVQEPDDPPYKSVMFTDDWNVLCRDATHPDKLPY